jgi:hypothetical protein
MFNQAKKQKSISHDDRTQNVTLHHYQLQERSVYSFS